MNGPLPILLVQSCSVDLHTAEAPIFNDSTSVTLEELGLADDIPDGGEITLYAVKCPQGKRQFENRRVGKAALYVDQDDWVGLCVPSMQTT